MCCVCIYVSVLRMYVRKSSQVCAYGGFIKERFERCLDLYLCPRALKKRPEVDPDRGVCLSVCVLDVCVSVCVHVCV